MAIPGLSAMFNSGGGGMAFDSGSSASGKSGDVASYGNTKGNLISFSPQIRAYGSTVSQGGGEAWKQWAAVGGVMLLAAVLYKAVK